ncbi:MAG: hypothetical protein IIA60_12125 [Candidatus Marinimicrobia bacterium]|nr:hypothetical protein [Candidatus Neomarinimicrobiota bacterium]
MSNIKQAVDAAIKALSEFFPGQPFIGLELEEVIPAEDSSYWLITLGYYVKDQNPPTGLALMAGSRKYERKYKVLKVDTATLNVISMTIRSMGTSESRSADNS